MGREPRGTRLLVARGWSRHGQSVMRGREGVPELVGLHLAEWRHEQWLGVDGEPVMERAQRPTGRQWWLVGPSEELPAPAARQHSAPADPTVPARRPVGWEHPDRGFLSALPVADPPRLLAMLLDAHPPTRFLGAADQVAASLASGRYPAPVVAALAEGLLAVETVDVVDEVPDLWGRPCTALRQRRSDGAVHDLLLDPSQTSYRGHHELAGPDHDRRIAAGTLIGGDVLITVDDVVVGVVPADLDDGPDPVAF